MTKIARTIRDVCLIAVGILAFITTPPSVQAIGLYGVLGYVWGAMMLLGAIASLYGVLRNRLTPEIYGCSFVAGAFAIWAFTAAFQPDATLTSYMISLVFLSGTAGQFYRIGMITEGRVNRK